MKNLFCSFLCLLLLPGMILARTGIVLERGPAIWINGNGQHQEVRGSTSLEKDWKFLMYSPNITLTPSAIEKGPRYQIWDHRMQLNGFYYSAKVYQYTSVEIGATEDYPCPNFFNRYNVYLKQIFAGKISTVIEEWILIYDSKADMDGDEKISWKDVEIMNVKISGNYDKRFDMNDDFFLTNEDVVYVYALLGATPDLKVEEAIPFINHLTQSPTKPNRSFSTFWGKMKMVQK